METNEFAQALGQARDQDSVTYLQMIQEVDTVYQQEVQRINQIIDTYEALQAELQGLKRQKQEVDAKLVQEMQKFEQSQRSHQAAFTGLTADRDQRIAMNARLEQERDEANRRLSELATESGNSNTRIQELEGQLREVLQKIHDYTIQHHSVANVLKRRRIEIPA